MTEGARVQDRYEVISLLGKGGAAAVYSVLDTSTRKKLALKQLVAAPGGARSERHELRFRREFHTMAGLVHPNIVEVYDYGVSKEGPFYTMELLEGQDLRALGRCAIDVACSLLRDVASALALVHARHLLHRDVGPRNVRRSGDGAAKLLDFGVLASSGVAGDVAGTPPCMAPETVRLLPVDHKVDLYGLGALAYWLLTGRHAYPAKSVMELERLWAERPPRPSDLRPEVPAALNDLVLSLLSLDPLGRPTRAAEVIDRLVAIADLDPTTDSEADARQGYLLSAALVGRHAESAKIRDHVEKAASGQGATLLFEAPLGEGKSRLLRECSLQAQLAGMEVVLGTNDATGRGPYGLLRELTRALVARLPADVFEVAAPRAAVIGRVLPEVVPEEVRGKITFAPLDGDPRQDRMRLQAALAAFLVDVCKRRRIAVLVDDVQHADEGSAAVLAQLAHAARGCGTLLAVTLGSDEAVHAQAAVASIQEVAERMRLRPLTIAEVEQLASALFGDAPHARLARWMHGVTGGSPLRVLDLTRHLVDRKIVRYEFGLWTIPDDLEEHALPPGLPQVMDRKIGGLRATTRALAEVLAVHGGELPLEVCVALDESHSERGTFGALDELLFEEVLIGSGERVRFRHEGLREALLRGLVEPRRSSLHLRVARLLTSRGDVPEEREAEVGWHFFHGGERSRAAPLLARAGQRQHAAQSYRDAVPPLEAALGVYEAEGSDPATCLELRRMLVIAGVAADRAVLLRYAEPTFQALRRRGGVELAERLARITGRKLGLGIGILVAWLRWAITPRARRGPSPVFAFTTLGVLVTATASAYSLVFDLDGLRRHLRHLEVFAAFPGRLPYVSYLMCQSLLAIPLGRWRTVRENMETCLAITSAHPPHDPFYRRNGIATAHYMLASALATDQNPAFEREVEEVKKQDLRFFDVSAEMVRLFYHRLRGEEEQARAIEARVELSFVQLGSMWIFESQLPWVSSFAYAITRDVMGLKRCIEKLDRLCKAGYGFEVFLDIARGEYYRERGQLDAAHAALVRAIGALSEEDLFRRQRALTAYAEVLLAQGRSVEAQRTAEEAFALALNPENVHVTWRIRCGRVVALALAANGEHGRAAQKLDELMRDVAFVKSPTMSGALHEARARLALLAGDRETYAHHLAEMERWFRPTRNAALVARCERLAAAGSGTSGAGADLGDESMTRRDATDDVAAAMEGCHTAADRAARALDFLVGATSGAEGALYLLQDGGLRLSASTTAGEPPASWMALLARAVETADEEGATVVVAPEEARSDKGPAWMPVVLALREGERGARAARTGERTATLDGGPARKKRTIVGAAAIVQGAIPLEPPDEATLVALARELTRGEEAMTVSIGSLTF
jgi:tetratricopeptide (TPR) repeat protein